MLRFSALAALLIAGLAHSASAQQAVPARAEAANSAATPVDVNRLPIDLDRINRRLRQSSEREERDGLRLRYSIDVYGTAPPIVIFDPKRDNLLTGPVPHSAPTHQDMLEHVTPQEFRSPVMDFSALARWLADKAKSK